MKMMSVDEEFYEYAERISKELSKIAKRKVTTKEVTKIFNILLHMKGKPIIIIMKKDGRHKSIIEDIHISAKEVESENHIHL